jgi:hypothetical protein
MACCFDELCLDPAACAIFKLQRKTVVLEVIATIITELPPSSAPSLSLMLLLILLASHTEIATTVNAACTQGQVP